MNVYFRVLNGPLDWGWVNEQVGILRCEDTTGIVAVDADTDKRVGACIMDNWTQNSVQCHFMLTTPQVLRYGFLQCCFGFVFNAKKVKYVYGLVPSNNDKAVKLNKHLGFTIKTRLEEAFEKDVDYLIMELKRENCKYIPPLEELENG